MVERRTEEGDEQEKNENDRPKSRADNSISHRAGQSVRLFYHYNIQKCKKTVMDTDTVAKNGWTEKGNEGVRCKNTARTSILKD